MGNCASAAELLEKQEIDENVVYVVDEEGPISEQDGTRKIASLFSRRGMKGPNQDTAILCQGFGKENGIFCGVFDGHGRMGHMISRLVRDYLPFLILSQRNNYFLSRNNSNFNDNDSNDSDSHKEHDTPCLNSQMFEEWKQACINALKAMDCELRIKPGLDCSFSGTTAVYIIKQGKDLIIANLGDSRAILARVSEQGYIEAKQLTTDFKPAIPEEAERIKKHHGRVFCLRDEPTVARVWLPDENYPGLAMSRSLGDLQLKHYGVISTPQVIYHRITDRDLFIVLATDGVWDVLRNDQVVSTVCNTKNKMEASRVIVEEAVQTWKTKFPASKRDDCTAACLFLNDYKQFNEKKHGIASADKKL
ncbi:Protein phosphatase 2C family protein [Rhynchospora pubera]|uniref:protein-serine/threonine phosphatase n=1 Tax=Rhynchospora pubera TaxID=906938 RepID=A0AAV8EL83_9POAL|nr:Protein phosphatase 2C family protein [Rhynchospora pubera]